ncbi:hypothetical protein GGS20DRAFT_248134 [Poronia punctata]|nr:hypothetical protein GGS20DRAFT_248134 [Poronia punctata]
MRADILFTSLAVAGSASARVMRLAASSIHYDWDVTGWTAACLQDGCTYDFQIAGEANYTSRPPRPAFKARCAGEGEGAPYRLCQRLDGEDNDALVVAKLLPSNNHTINGTHQATIQVSLKHTDLDIPTTWWNYTGHANSMYGASKQSFTMNPDEVFGVA